LGVSTLKGERGLSFFTVEERCVRRGFSGQLWGRVGSEERGFLKRKMKREEGSVMNGKCPTRVSEHFNHLHCDFIF